MATDISVFLFVLLVLSVITQGVFHGLVFSKLTKCELPKKALIKQKVGVSVVIAARNEAVNLANFLPSILSQNYSDFELIVVSDRSSDNTIEVLEKFKQEHAVLKSIVIEDEVEGINPKKRALQTAIEAASKEYILCTDADCNPRSNNWIASMVAELDQEKNIVLGFSPYKEEPSFLNLFIRFETLYTAIQYLSLTLMRKPYMAVGRNFLYKRDLFFENNGFEGFYHTNGGDDDLLLAKMSTCSNTAVCLNPSSFVESVAENTLVKYLKQKHRHLSVGVKYSYPQKMRLGLLNTSHIIFYLTVFNPLSFTYFGLPILLFLMLRMGMIFRTFYRAGKQLEEHFLNPFELLLLDFLYAVGYLFLGMVTIFYRSRIWK